MSTDITESKQSYSELLNGLFKVDVNSESLKKFLESIVSAVNQQSKRLQAVQTELENRPSAEEIERGLAAISDSVIIKDVELSKSISSLAEKPKPEATGKKIEDGSNKVCNKIALFGHAFSVLFKQQQIHEKKISEIQSQLPNKIEGAQMKAKVKKTKTKILGELDDLKKKLSKQVDEISKKSSASSAKLEIEVREMEKKTLWKIQDCEQLLGKRVSGEFVDSSLKGLEDKIKRELAKLKEESVGGVSARIEDLEDKLKSIDDNNAERIKSMKTALKELENTVTGKFAMNDKLEILKRNLNEKMTELDTKLLVIDRRGDANNVLEQARDLVRNLDAKLNENIRNHDELVDRINHMSNSKSSGSSGGAASSDDNCVDPHKLCLLEAGLKRLKDEFNEQKRNYTLLDDDLRRKFDTFEHKILGQFSLMKKQGQAEYNRDEIISLIERAKVIVEEKVKVVTKDLEEVKPKVAAFTELEKKIKKKFREISDTTELSKKIQDKADQADVNRQQNIMDERMRSMQETFISLKRDFDSVEQFYLQLNAMIQSGQQEAISVITGNTKIIPNHCASCGSKGRFIQNSGEMKGMDGKIYKADVTGVSCFDNQEVFDIYPSQLSPERMQQGQSSSSTKQQVVSFREKPGSAKKQ